MKDLSVVSISPHQPFGETLAAGILAEIGNAPERLAEVQILLPTRRACRALADSFLRLSNGQPLLLPRMKPLGDLDEDALDFDRILSADSDDLTIPPAIPSVQRHLLLTRLVLAMATEPMRHDQAARLARELARLLDQVQTERLDLRDLKSIVPEEHSEHWMVTLDFLAILMDHWPLILAEYGYVDPAVHRNLLLETQARHWQSSPPDTPVYAAGSTGSIPATAELLKVVAGLPNGVVVLPGVDASASNAVWSAILDDPGHPQFGMARLVERLGIDRRDIGTWPRSQQKSGIHKQCARASLVQRALAPASVFAVPEMHTESGDLAALDGMVCIDCPGAEDEARVIALIMRETLETPDRTIALVTPNRSLARRVAVELKRWSLDIDDSAGQPLLGSLPGTFVRLVARVIAEDFAPVSLLSLLKHPLSALGLTPASCRATVRELELQCLRGPRLPPGVSGLRAALSEDGGPISSLLERLDEATSALSEQFDRPEASLSELIAAHVQASEALAATVDCDGASRLWIGEAGEATARFFFELSETSDSLGPIAPRDYPAFIDVFLEGHVVRPRFGKHPRLAIWGPLEARLQRADVMILGGLNEDTWPPTVEPSPWMSRPMMRDFGLPLPERRIGLSAHDFCQAFSTPRLYLTRALREDGAPTTPCRWLLRLELFTKTSEWENQNAAEAARWLYWQRELDAPSKDEQAFIKPPRPTPPLTLRPRKFSVTQVETWMRDPYAVYARHILRLKALEPLDADPTAAEYGQAVHRALDAFNRACPDGLPMDAYERLIACGRQAFHDLQDRPGVRAFWWPRFERIAAWFIDTERLRRGDLAGSHTEIIGRLTFDAPGGPFELTAKADRIDILVNGGLVLIDYKTGMPPPKKDVFAGFAPQLPLEGAIALNQGFSGLGGRKIERLEYWRLTGGDPPADLTSLPDATGVMSKQALEGLKNLVATFDRVETPYPAVPRSAVAPRYSDYAHLARIKEWSAGPEDST